MNHRTKCVLFRAPRILAIVYILFLGLFALDVVGPGYGFVQTPLALLIHLAPNMVLIIILVLAWRRGCVGAVLPG